MQTLREEVKKIVDYLISDGNEADKILSIISKEIRIAEGEGSNEAWRSSYPHDCICKECEQSKTSKLTKSQNKRFDEKFPEFVDTISDFGISKNIGSELKQHLADELAITRKEVVEEVKKDLIDELFKAAWSLAEQGNYHGDVQLFLSGFCEWVNERMLGKVIDK